MNIRRKGEVVALVAIALIAIVVICLPFLASTSVIRNRIALEIGNWSGYRVVFDDAPKISLFPSVTADLKNVRFYNWGQPGEQPVIKAENIRIGLSALSAISGEIAFTGVTILRPVVYVRGEGSTIPYPDWPAAGKLMGGIRAAREAVKANPAAPDLSNLPDDGLGSVVIVDGRVVELANSAERQLVTSIEGTLNWPRLDGGVEISLKGIWRGESVSVSANAPRPLLLLGGGDAAIKFLAVSNPLRTGFEGRMMLADAPFFDGALSITTPSLTRVLEWSGSPVAERMSIGATTLSGHATGDPSRAKIKDVSLTIDGNKGVGALDFSFNKSSTTVAGTLDFGALDLQSFVTAFSNLPLASEDASAIIETGAVPRVDLDLRLSAQTARLGPFSFTNVAATAQVKKGFAAFDISDATAFTGTVQVGLRIDRDGTENNGDLRILASDVDGAELAKAIGNPALFPDATCTLSVILNGPAITWQSLLEQSKGSFTAKFRSGTVPRLNMTKFLERSKTGGFFRLNEIQDGSLALKSAEIETQISGGSARIQKAEIMTGNYKIKLSGYIPFKDGSLALSGRVLRNGETDGALAAAFFVGGSWRSPYFSPVVLP